MTETTSTQAISESSFLDRIAENSYVQLLVTAGPILLLEGIFFLGPLFIMLMIATMEMENYNLVAHYGIDNFVAGVTKVQNIAAFENTVLIAALTTVTAAIVAYPIAYYIARFGGEYQNQLAALVIIPFWTNYVVRIYGWRIILSEDGLLNNFLSFAGIINEPLTFVLNTRFSIWFGLVYLWLPFMILPLYSTLGTIRDEYVEAAYDLGASRWKVFKRIIFPLSVPGLVAGTTFVFIFSMGAYIVPSLLGGGIPYVGTRIQYEFGFGADWPAGSALGSILMLIVLVALGVMLKYANMEDLF
ncbi:ABC-type spermidine/putrescine transport system permease subunit I [Halarchaeum solikamskense]|uniref:ABC transporter permease n=1 Tax=Halarchaeum nitratireducens TaxID=489913 RepID=UPI001B3A93CD|nr:ABC transporter permease [Halarchaeum solikamskense]MBP2252404.1 ABC-type spermidine/putrescine transport system permease subunit I [Halarchaeum solikamskense]